MAKFCLYFRLLYRRCLRSWRTIEGSSFQCSCQHVAHASSLKDCFSCLFRTSQIWIVVKIRHPLRGKLFQDGPFSSRPGVEATCCLGLGISHLTLRIVLQRPRKAEPRFMGNGGLVRESTIRKLEREGPPYPSMSKANQMSKKQEPEPLHAWLAHKM